MERLGRADLSGWAREMERREDFWRLCSAGARGERGLGVARPKGVVDAPLRFLIGSRDKNLRSK